MELSDYKIGDRVNVYVYRMGKTATVTNVSEECVEVKLDNPLFIKFVDGSDFYAYLDPETYMKRFLIKDKRIIDKL